MAKIMEDIANLTEGTSFNSYKYSFDSVRTPEPSYDDNPDGFTIVWDKNGETHPSIEPVLLKDYAVPYKYHTYHMNSYCMKNTYTDNRYMSL